METEPTLRHLCLDHLDGRVKIESSCETRRCERVEQVGRDPPVIPEMSSPGPIMRASKGIDDLQTVSNNNN